MRVVMNTGELQCRDCMACAIKRPKLTCLTVEIKECQRALYFGCADEDKWAAGHVNFPSGD